MAFWSGGNVTVHGCEARMKRYLGCILMSCLSQAWASPAAQVFVSFSMPPQLLRQTLIDSAHLHIPAILNGLHHNSMKETALKVMALSQNIPGLNLQIDPTQFERFGINKVPALIVSNGDQFDVIYGNLPLREALSRITDHQTAGAHHA